ncbi:Protein FAM32A [Operophtera brumata]|uniref:Protein FAM32A n=1 Tax=Operophtera brumata TaxID=104452 RepID=A0A0L7LCV9_OPEBR|nr:Protein FAM32A [Operophtera brumata]
MGEDDEYACVNRSQLKLKDNSGIKKKKKKKSSKESEKRIKDEVKQHVKQNTDCKTKAEMAFQKMQEKMKFNQHLDSLTEHFDIPKVSWTK